MRLLLAAPAFGPTEQTEQTEQTALTGPQVVEAMRAGWARTAPRDEFDLLPLSDGARGFLEAAEAVLPPGSARSRVELPVAGPLGGEHSAYLLLVDGPEPTAYLEAAQICGPALVQPGASDPGRATTTGLGQALAAARAAGARRIVVGVEGTADTAGTDGGAGLLHALGVGGEVIALGGAVLGAVTAADLTGLEDVVRDWRAVDLILATGTQAPLLGFGGASATGAVLNGATPAAAQALEAALGHFADVLQRRLPAQPDLLAGATVRLDRRPGAGAGGGVGFALAVLGGRVAPAGRFILDRPEVRDRLSQADRVLVGVAELDPFALRGTALATLCELAGELAVPVVALAGRAPAGRREAMAAGISGLYAMSEGFVAPNSSRAIEDWTARIARTWGRL